MMIFAVSNIEEYDAKTNNQDNEEASLFRNENEVSKEEIVQLDNLIENAENKTTETINEDAEKNNRLELNDSKIEENKDKNSEIIEINKEEKSKPVEDKPEQKKENNSNEIENQEEKQTNVLTYAKYSGYGIVCIFFIPLLVYLILSLLRILFLLIYKRIPNDQDTNFFLRIIRYILRKFSKFFDVISENIIKPYKWLGAKFTSKNTNQTEKMV